MEASEKNELKEHIDSFMSENKQLKIRFFDISDATEKKLDYILNEILQKRGRDDLKPVIYTCLKELIINATKANFKHIYLESTNASSEMVEEFQNEIINFKHVLSEKGPAEFARKAKEIPLAVEVHFIFAENFLRLVVLNDAPLSDHGKNRILEKIKIAAKYENLGEFYIHEADNLESSGAGIALILFLLKEIGVSVDNLTYEVTKNGITLATLDIPL